MWIFFPDGNSSFTGLHLKIRIFSINKKLFYIYSGYNRFNFFHNHSLAIYKIQKTKLIILGFFITFYLKTLKNFYKKGCHFDKPTNFNLFNILSFFKNCTPEKTTKVKRKIQQRDHCKSFNWPTREIKRQTIS